LEAPNRLAVEAMEIVIHRVLAAGASAQAEGDRLSGELEKAEEGAYGPSTSFSWMSVRTAKSHAILAVAVTYGAASRVAVFDTRASLRLVVPKVGGWMHPWRVEPHFAPDGTLLLLSGQVEDVGFRLGYRTDLLDRTANGYRLARTWTRQGILDYDGAELKGGTLVLRSIDDPVSFYVVRADAVFQRTETYRIAHGAAKLVSNVAYQPELRFVDAWIAQARKAKKPTVLEKRLASALSGEWLELDSWRQTPATGGKRTVTVDFGDVTLILTLAGSPGRYRVLDVSVKHRSSQ